MTLQPIEADALAEHEATIANGLQTFKEVGYALADIRDRRLYRGEYVAFEDYCRERWNLSRTHADRMITASQVAEEMAPIGAISTESQARAIKPILRDHGPEVAADVLAEAEASGKITARSITEAAERRLIVVEDEAPLPANEWMAREGYADPVDDWTDDERRLAELLDSGHTIVVNMRDDAHARLWQYAVQEHKAERIDRKSIWGNPFILGDDGDRDTVCDAYANIYLPHKPRLLAEVSDLKGRALGCWCAPARCHGDHLARLATS